MSSHADDQPATCVSRDVEKVVDLKKLVPMCRWNPTDISRLAFKLDKVCEDLNLERNYVPGKKGRGSKTTFSCTSAVAEIIAPKIRATQQSVRHNPGKVYFVLTTCYTTDIGGGWKYVVKPGKTHRPLKDRLREFDMPVKALLWCSWCKTPEEAIQLEDDLKDFLLTNAGLSLLGRNTTEFMCVPIEVPVKRLVDMVCKKFGPGNPNPDSDSNEMVPCVPPHLSLPLPPSPFGEFRPLNT